MTRTEQSPQLPALAVVYGLGAASPFELMTAAMGEARLLFLIDSRDPHCAAMAPVLAKLAPTIDLAVTADADIAIACESTIGELSGIATFSEAKLRTTVSLAQKLGLAFHSIDTVSALTDKSIQRDLLNAAGVSITRQATASSAKDLPRAVEAVGYPVVIKPVRGNSGAYTMRCDNEDQLRSMMGHLLPDRPASSESGWTVEELLRAGRHPRGEWLGDYVSVESVTDAEGIWHFSVSDRLPLQSPFREHGVVVPSALPSDLRAEVEEMAGAALRALGVSHGLTHTELKLTPTGPRILEVNGRLGGGIARLMNRCSDLDPIRLGIRAAVGASIQRLDISFRAVSLVYIVLPPARQVRINSISDVSRFRAHKKVWEALVHAEPGTALDWRNGMLERVFTIRATAESHAEAADIVGWLDAQSADCVEYEFLE